MTQPTDGGITTPGYGTELIEGCNGIEGHGGISHGTGTQFIEGDEGL